MSIQILRISNGDACGCTLFLGSLALGNAIWVPPDLMARQDFNSKIESLSINTTEKAFLQNTELPFEVEFGRKISCKEQVTRTQHLMRKGI
jgi:hypothetical protein